MPVVRRTGSIGCADIGLMGQIGAVLTGVGEAVYQNRRLSAADGAGRGRASSRSRLAPRDSLASISVNAVGFAAAAEAMRDAAGAVRMLLATSLTTAGALGASRDPWKAVAHVGTEREAEIGAWLYLQRHGLGLAQRHPHPGSAEPAHDGAGVRHGVRDAAGLPAGPSSPPPAAPTTTRWSSTGEVLTSGGSLPLDVTIFLQTAQLALAHAARNSFNRCVLLGNGGAPRPADQPRAAAAPSPPASARSSSLPASSLRACCR